jgi:hypothetical protein
MAKLVNVVDILLWIEDMQILMLEYNYNGFK